VERGEWKVAWDLVDGFDARVAKLAELLGSDAVEVFDGVVGTGAVAAGEEGAVVRGGAVGAGGYIGERGLEHLVLGRDLGRDAWAELGNGAGDVGAREEWAVVRVAVLVVEMHELDAPYPEACLFNDVGLDGGVGEVLGFYSGGGFDFGEDPGVALLGERVDCYEDAVFEEACF
jgi:hypothetical protein